MGFGMAAGACLMHPMEVSGRGLLQPKRDIREPIATATRLNGAHMAPRFHKGS